MLDRHRPLLSGLPEYRYGQIVMGNSYRQPSLLAKVASTMQVLTGGKLILGIGAGWMESEYRMYGYEMPRRPCASSSLTKRAGSSARMWTESPASFQGEHYTIDAGLREPAARVVPPIMIGGQRRAVDAARGREARRLVESGGHSPAEDRRKSAVLAEHCRSVGRDSTRSCTSGSASASRSADSEDRGTSHRRAQPLYQHSPRTRLVGTPEQIVAKLEERMDIGVRHFILRFLDFPRTDQALRFATEIAPKLRRRHGS